MKSIRNHVSPMKIKSIKLKPPKGDVAESDLAKNILSTLHTKESPITYIKVRKIPQSPISTVKQEQVKKSSNIYVIERTTEKPMTSENFFENKTV